MAYSFCFGINTLISEYLLAMKKRMLTAVAQVNKWKRVIIFQHDAQEQAMLEYMSKAERELWQKYFEALAQKLFAYSQEEKMFQSQDWLELPRSTFFQQQYYLTKQRTLLELEKNVSTKLSLPYKINKKSWIRCAKNMNQCGKSK